MVGTTIIRVVYGLDTSGSGDKYVRLAEEAISHFNEVFEPGRYLVNTFPWLRFVPTWFPGANFQRRFASLRPTVRAMRDVPWEAAMERKVGRPSFQCQRHWALTPRSVARRSHPYDVFLHYTDRPHRK